MKLLLLVVAVALAQAELAPLYTAKERISNRHIIVLQNDVDVDAFTSRFQVDAAITGQRPLLVRKLKTALNAFIADLSPEAVELVRSFPGVEFVEEDSMGYIDAQDPPSWGTDRINQQTNNLDQNDDMPLGANANIFVIDTGIRTSHEDFEGRARDGIDYVDGNGGDCQGHGTHCAGTVAGKTYGVAKGATVWAVRVCNCWGGCRASDVISGVNYVAGHKNSGTANVVASMSLGLVSPALRTATENAIAGGVVLVTSSGNDYGDACAESPNDVLEAIVVGNTDQNDYMHPSSNYGSCVDILAPGTSIVSCSNRNDTLSSTKTGTSMSCPHVAGAAGIYLSDLSVEPADVEDKLIELATDGVITGLPDSLTPNKLLYVPPSV